MKDHQRRVLRLFALFFMAYLGIDNPWTPHVFQKSVTSDFDRSLRATKGTASLTKGKDSSKRHHGEGQVVISGKKVNYRYPPTFSKTTSDSIQHMDLVVGVLSSSSSTGTRMRQDIRDTWAKDYKGRVFFVVAGNWSTIEEQFEELQDLIWVDMEEEWHHLTYKVQTFYHAVENHFGLSYDYLMKTDDDSYVNLPKFQSFIQSQPKKNYYAGKCMWNRQPIRDPRNRYYIPEEVYSSSTYPVYAAGDGYLVSKDANKCMLDYIASIDYMAMEDVATGILADKCSVPCTKSWLITRSGALQHHKKGENAMQKTHANFYKQS